MPGTVTVNISSGPTVDKPTINLPSHGDEVEFVANPPSLQFDVTFDTTPFSGKHFHNHSPNAHRTGKFDPSKKATHKYTVTIAGQPPLDPVIIVQGP
jgi:hypothetical protein